MVFVDLVASKHTHADPFQNPNQLERIFSSWHETFCATCESLSMAGSSWRATMTSLVSSWHHWAIAMGNGIGSGTEMSAEREQGGQEANLGWITSCTPTSPHLPVAGKLRPQAQSSVWYPVNLKMQPLFCLHPGFTPQIFPRDLWPVLGTYRRSGSLIRWWFYCGGKGAATVSSLQRSMLMWCRSSIPCRILAFLAAVQAICVH